MGRVGAEPGGGTAARGRGETAGETGLYQVTSLMCTMEPL